MGTWLFAVLVVVTAVSRDARAGEPTPPRESTAAAVEACAVENKAVCQRWKFYCELVPTHEFCVLNDVAGAAHAVEAFQYLEDFKDIDGLVGACYALAHHVGGPANDAEVVCDGYRQWCAADFIPSLNISRVCFAMGYSGEMPAAYVQQQSTAPVEGGPRQLDEAGIEAALREVRGDPGNIYIETPKDSKSASAKLFEGLLAPSPATNALSVTARFLGAGAYDDSSGAQANGFTIGLSQEAVAGKERLGLLFALEAELGGYKEHGMIGSIGADAGPGIRGKWGYLGVSAGVHLTATPFQRKPWVPVLLHLALMNKRWGVFLVGGYGWRPEMPDDGSPEALVTYEAPAGLNASVFRITFRVSRVHVGFGMQDLDGNMIGSLYLGGGAMEAEGVSK